MNATRQVRNLALAGFMGAGKSSVGRLAAAELGFQFVDTDELIEQRTGARIPEIFAGAGEEAFRGLERDLAAESVTWSDTVIATGGGFVIDPANLEALKSHALVICLWASPETVYQRTRHQTHRPLLAAADAPARIRDLLAAREAAYKQADVLVNTEQRSLRAITAHVLHHFRAARENPPAP